jgi:hypothetical protein
MADTWSELSDVRERLLKRWDRGELLTAWAHQTAFQPIVIPLRGPSTVELAERFDDVRAWLQRWNASAAEQPVTLRTRSTGHRSIGANALPSHVEIESYDALWQLIGRRAQVRRFDELREVTAAALPSLVPWMNRKAMTVLKHEADWARLLRTVGWITAAGFTSSVYLRAVPVPAVDTKFIEQHRGIIAELLDEILPPERVDAAYPPSQFERRYGFAVKPTLVRFRSLDAGRPVLPGVSELVVRSSEFHHVAPDMRTVIIIENEITYLAFPPVPDAAVIFGSGFAVSGYGALPWFASRRVLYWGDLDTHGFVALDRLRALVPHAESMLMDSPTLLAHRGQWVQEENPTRARLSHLMDSESAVYRDLCQDTYGNRIRLEQERIQFPMLQAVLAGALGC